MASIPETCDVHISKVLPEITVTVRMIGVRWWQMRFRLGSWLILAGAWIAKCKMRVESKEAA